MKRMNLILGLTVASLLLSVAACDGGSEPAAEKVVEAAAAELNFTTADLGPEWEQVQNAGLDEITILKDIEHIQDANLRMFGATEITGLVTSFLFRTKTIDQAVMEMAGDLVKSMAEDLEAQVAGLTMESLYPPDVGDEASMSGGNLPKLGLNVYVVVFRKANVVVTFSLIANADVATEELVVSYAKKLEAKMR